MDGDSAIRRLKVLALVVTAGIVTSLGFHWGPPHTLVCIQQYKSGETFEAPPPNVVTIADLTDYVRDQTHNCGQVEVLGGPLGPCTPHQFDTRFGMESDRKVYIYNYTSTSPPPTTEGVPTGDG